LETSPKEILYYAQCISYIKRDLETTNSSICILQKLAMNAPNLQAIKLPLPTTFSGDCKDLPNPASNIHCKLHREDSHFTENQYKMHYIYGYLKGNAQNWIQSEIHPNKIQLNDVGSLSSILQGAFSDPNKLGTTYTILNYLTQPNQ
jgi:hypothetical protein